MRRRQRAKARERVKDVEGGRQIGGEREMKRVMAYARAGNAMFLNMIHISSN